MNFSSYFERFEAMRDILSKRSKDREFVSPEASDVYLRYIEGQVRGSATVEDFNAHIVSKRRENVNGHVLSVGEALIGDTTYPVIYTFAHKLSHKKKVDERDVHALFDAFGFDDESATDYLLGTLSYAEALRLVFETNRARLKQLPRFSYGAAKDPLTDVADAEPEQFKVLTIPPRLHYEHACNVAVGNPVIDDLPELDNAWSTFVDDLFTAHEEGKRTRYTSPRTRLPPPQVLNYQTHTLVHPNYGKYGYFAFDLKEEFSGEVSPVTEFIPHTYSTAVAEHIPAALFRWNRKDPFTNLYSGAGRLGRLPQPKDKVQLDVMQPYIDAAVDWLINELEAAGLHVNHDAPSMALAWRWLASAHFPTAKKAKYAEAFYRASRNREEPKSAIELDYTHKAFPKNECYLAGDKAQRQILAGSQEAAAVLAPMCDIIGNVFFSLEFTSKKIPVRARPRVAIERFGMESVILNDMSAFEGSITKEVKRLIEHRVFLHFFPEYRSYIDRCEEDITCYVYGAKFSVPNCRCSGDPQTSLGNSITNIVSIIAASLYAQDIVDGDPVLHANDLPVAWVEGDDSLVRWPERWGKVTTRNVYFRAYHDAFVKMGFATKMEIKDFVGNAGYCSMFFTERAKNSPSVAQTLLDLPWDHNNTHRGADLLCMKAQSVAAEAPGQPLTCAIVDHYAGRRFSARIPFNAYEYEEFIARGFTVTLDACLMTVEGIVANYELPDDDDRALFERRYGISVSKQLQIEGDLRAHGLPVMWKTYRRELRRICVVDGIDLDACHRYYEDNIDHEPDNKYDTAEYKYKVRNGRLVVSRSQSYYHDNAVELEDPACPSPISPIEFAHSQRQELKHRRRALFRQNNAEYIREYRRAHGLRKTRKLWDRTHEVVEPEPPLWRRIVKCLPKLIGGIAVSLAVLTIIWLIILIRRPNVELAPVSVPQKVVTPWRAAMWTVFGNPPVSPWYRPEAMHKAWRFLNECAMVQPHTWKFWRRCDFWIGLSNLLRETGWGNDYEVGRWQGVHPEDF